MGESETSTYAARRIDNATPSSSAFFAPSQVAWSSPSREPASARLCRLSAKTRIGSTGLPARRGRHRADRATASRGGGLSRCDLACLFGSHLGQHPGRDFPVTEQFWKRGGTAARGLDAITCGVAGSGRDGEDRVGPVPPLHDLGPRDWLHLKEVSALLCRFAFERN